MERITQIMEELEMHDEEVLREMYAKLLLENERLEALLNGDDNKKLYEVFESITDYQELGEKKMAQYNYEEVMKNDVLAAIKEYMEYENVSVEDLDIDTLKDYLWADDSVTGNGSGSYTFNSALSKEYVLDNEDLQVEVIRYFDIDGETIADKLHDWEYWDVSIRCYLLDEVLQEVLEELQ